MKKAKFLRMIAAVTLVLSMVASPMAISAESSQLKFNPGTYKGEAKGFGGPVSVEVTVSADTITGIKAAGASETAGIGSKAIEEFPGAIVKNQSTGVDTIAGCTITSNAIKAAVETALQASGADLTALRSMSRETPSEKAQKELSTDILIIGGGGSGLTAALTASAAGNKVILLEKMSFLGGAAAISGGQVNAGNSEFQKEKGYEDTVDQVFLDLLKGGHYSNDARITRLYAENVGETFDWLVDTLGIKFVKDPAALPEHSALRVWAAEGGAGGYTKTILENLEKSNIDVMMNTRGTELIMNDGTITGAIAEDADNIYNISAKAVVLATGGFGNNKDLLPQLLQESLYYGPVSATGDGHIMAQEIGAKMHYMQHGKIYPNGVEVAPGRAKSTWHASIGTCRDASTLIVDRSGQRVANENGLAEDIRKQMMEQPDKTLFLVMDAESFGMFKNLVVNVGKTITEEEIDQWLKNNGASAPVFTTAGDVKAAARAAGVDGDALAATIEQYNKMVEAGEDSEFGRTPLKPVGAGPYYLVEQKPRFATTLGGVQISLDMEVYDESDQPIPGLYAAGEVVGGVHGDDTIVSSAVGWAFTSGRVAGRIVSDKLLNQ